MSMRLIISLIIIFYITIGITFMGIFPDSKGEPNCSIIFLWPISIICFVSYTVLFYSYKFGKNIRKNFINTRNKRKNKNHNKEDRCDQIIKEILEQWDD